jgi:hypothetical protein
LWIPVASDDDGFEVVEEMTLCSFAKIRARKGFYKDENLCQLRTHPRLRAASHFDLGVTH